MIKGGERSGRGEVLRNGRNEGTDDDVGFPVGEDLSVLDELRLQ